METHHYVLQSQHSSPFGRNPHVCGAGTGVAFTVADMSDATTERTVTRVKRIVMAVKQRAIFKRKEKSECESTTW